MSVHSSASRVRLASVVVAALAATSACDGPSGGSAGSSAGTASPSTSSTAVPKNILAVMDKTNYVHSRWGLAVRDLGTGKNLIDLDANQYFPPGSTTKVFTGISTWNALKPDHRFVTPVYATGKVHGHTSTGSLVLVAQGDLVFGGRAKKDGTVDFRDFDHMEANTVPGMATLTPENPLAAINSLAGQIAKSGVTDVTGNVVIDDRLWAPNQELSGIPLDPMMINENVIDLSFTGHTPGQRAQFSYRPAISTQKVTSKVTTGKAGDPPNVTTTPDGKGDLVATGTVPANGKPIVQTADIEDPLGLRPDRADRRAGQARRPVGAATNGPNPVQLLPSTQTYRGDRRLSAFTSPPWSEYEKLILKVSHNKGADTNMCLLALTAHERECAAGLSLVHQYLTTHGVPGDGFTFADGRGGEPGDLTTPDAALEFSRPSHRGPMVPSSRVAADPRTRRLHRRRREEQSRPRDTSLPRRERSPRGDVAGQQVVINAETLIGYIDAASGRHLEFALYVNNLTLKQVSDLIQVFADEDHIAALLYDRY